MTTPLTVGAARVDVLIAEDNEFVAQLLVCCLSDHDMTTVVAADGESALQMIGTYRPHVLLLDIHLPRRTGLEILRHVRQDPAHSHMRVLVLTALGRWEMEEEVMREGANAYVHKPFDPFELTDMVRKLLAEARRESAA